MNWVYLSIAILCEVTATSALKASEGFSKPWPAAVAIAGFVLALFLLSLTLRTIPVGIAYAVWSGVGIVLISLIGAFAFKQMLDGPAIAGIALIVAGVAVINLASSAAAP